MNSFYTSLAESRLMHFEVESALELVPNLTNLADLIYHRRILSNHISYFIFHIPSSLAICRLHNRVKGININVVGIEILAERENRNKKLYKYFTARSLSSVTLKNICPHINRG